MSAAPAPLTFKQVLAIPAVRRIWIGQVVSVFGDFLALFAVIAVISFRLHGTPEQVTLVSISYMVPLVLFGPIAGVFVDRWNVKTTMIASDLVRCCLTVSLVFVNSVWGFYSIFFAISIFSSFFGPAQSVTIRTLVPRDGLLAANSLMMQAMQIARIVSPALAGTLVASFGPASCFWFDAASFGFSAFMLSTIKIGHEPVTAERGVKAVFADLFSGIRFIATNPSISFVTIAMAAALFAIGCFGPLIAIYVRDLLHQGSQSYGILSSMIGAGMIAGGFTVRRFAVGRSTHNMVLGGLLIMALAIYVVAAVKMAFFTGVGLFGMGLGVAFIIMPAQTWFQTETPKEMIGRVSSSFMSVLMLAQILGLALSGKLADALGIRALFFASGTFLLGMLWFGYLRLRTTKVAAAAAALLLVCVGPLAAQRPGLDAASMLGLVRVSDPQISPDGKLVAFSALTVDAGANKKTPHIYVMPIEGGDPRMLGDAADSNERPRWFPDSKQIAYTSDKGGASQIWSINADGSDAKQLTHAATEAANELVSPDGKFLVVTSDVFPDCGADEACNKKQLDAAKSNPVKARLITSLLYRHWTTWQGARRSHLLMIPLNGDPVRDLTPGKRDVPPFSLGGPDDYAISPDSRELCYAVVNDPEPATSTNSDLFAVQLSGDFKTTQITANPAADNSPAYSPDGKYLAWRAQSRPGYESDRWRLMLLERATGKATVLTDWLDRWVNSFTWAPDSAHIFFTAEDRGRQPIQYLDINGGGSKVAISGDNTLDDVQVTRDGKMVVFTRQSGSMPMEICRASSKGGAPVTMTHFNDALLGSHELMPFEEQWTKGAEDAQVQSFLVKPPGFDAAKKYPLLVFIHGGPQGAWAQTWSYRWNPQVFANAGYVVVMPNPRGSTGYGQKFIDDINGDWGGRAYDDVMAVVDQTSALPYIDKDRMVAAGGSYGGYMIDWILGHTTRFKALISHAGVYDLRSMAGSTEELWFVKWEFQGMPWENPETYNKWSPSMFVDEFQTPTLVMHGELDFRVPYTQGLQLFTALQLRKVPSEMLVFPDEGHWILKPQNSLLWYKTFIDWIDRWTKK